MGATYYFLQGHVEQASSAVDFSAAAVCAVPPFMPCRVVAVLFMADPQSTLATFLLAAAGAEAVAPDRDVGFVFCLTNLLGSSEPGC
jgi:hypothetical protein